VSPATPLSPRGLASRLRDHRVLIGVLLVPVLLGALIVWSLGDRVDQVEQVPAAVVNLDQPVTKKGEQPIFAGRLLAAGLTSPTEEQESLGWELTDAEDAERGLAGGDYYAVLTVPEDFSQTLARSLRGKNPEQASITLTSLDASSTIVTQISEQVARISAERLGERVTTSYLDTVFGETDKLAGKLGEAADGADQLASGTSQLGAGSQELASGLGELSVGADRLAEGADKLADGASQLAGGTVRLADGAGRLADGLGTLERRTDPLPAQTDRLADGAADVSQGVDGYSKLLQGWSRACKDPLIASRAPELCLATERAVGVDGSRAEEFRQGARRLAYGARQLADGMPELTRAIDQAASGAGELAAGTDELADGAQRLSTGAAKLGDGSGRLADGAGRASDGATRIAEGTDELGSGSEQLADGLDRGADAIPVYDDEERRDLAGVIAEPVTASPGGDGATPDGRTQVAPGAIAFVLWLGAFVTYLVRPALAQRLLDRPSTATRLAFAGLLPAVAIGAVQALLLFGTMLLLGADPDSPVLTLILMVLAAAGFAAINQGFVAVLGRRRGWLWTIAFTGVQVVSLGGVIPLDTAPWLLQVLNGVLPVPCTANGLDVTVLDAPGSLAAALFVLVSWAAVAFGATAMAARKAQQIDLEDLGDDERAVERV
jgi:putative membrane protein